MGFAPSLVERRRVVRLPDESHNSDLRSSIPRPRRDTQTRLRAGHRSGPRHGIVAGDQPGQPLGRASIAAFAVFVVGAVLAYVAAS